MRSACALDAPILNDVRSLLIIWPLHRSCDRHDDAHDQLLLRHAVGAMAVR